MAAWLITSIERLPPWARRAVPAVAVALLLGAVITSLTLDASLAGGARRTAPTARARTAPARSPQTLGRAIPPSVRQSVAATQLHVAGEVAGRFLRSYLQFAYGRASARSVAAVTPGLGGQLAREHAQVAPAERRRPRVLSLRLVDTTPGFVVATASVDDGGLAAYPLRFTLQDRAGCWLVSSVQEG